jgi:hypothetical protein
MSHSVVPPAPLNLVREPKSPEAATEAALLKQLEAKRRAAKKAISDRKKADKARLNAQEKKDAFTQKKELRELQKAELQKPVRDYIHGDVWDRAADARNDYSATNKLTPAEAEREQKMKAIARLQQMEREASEAEDRAFKLKQQKKAEKEEAAMREKVRLKQAADRKAEKEEARRIKEEMEMRHKERMQREAAVAKDKLEDALRERRTILAKKEKEQAWQFEQMSTWKKDMEAKREQDNVKEQAAKKEAELEEKRRRKRQMAEWKEREDARLAEEAAAKAKAKAEKVQFHHDNREKAIKEEMLRLQRKIDAEQILAQEALEEQERVAKAAERVAAEKEALDGEVNEMKSWSFVKLW